VNTINPEISEYLSTLSSYVEPIKNICKKYLKYCSIVDSDYSLDKNGKTLPFLEVIYIGHNPKAHHNSYMIEINKGIDPSWVVTFSERTNITIPKMYEDFLIEMNGCTLFNTINESFMLYGLSPKKYCPPDYFYNNEVPNKDFAAYDLEAQNMEIKNKNNFEGFLIGHRELVFWLMRSEFVYYFISHNKILAIKNNKIKAEYDNFNDFLKREIKLAKKEYFKCYEEKDLCLCGCTKLKKSNKKYQNIKNYKYLDEIDIGVLNIKYRKSIDRLLLPYAKPDEISSVFESAYEGLIIVEIKVDNVPIKPEIGNGRISGVPTSEKISSDKSNKIKMRWDIRPESGTMYDIVINKGIFFQDFNYLLEKNVHRPTFKPYSYHIPYGGKEVKVKYRIYYPDRTIDETIYSVKFNLIWPDIRLADNNGNIFPPNEYVDLGIIKPQNNLMSIELPINLTSGKEITDQLFPRNHIDSRWLEIYELIGDGKIINQIKVNKHEKANIDFLTEKEDIKNGSNITDMIWRTYGNKKEGLNFYIKFKDDLNKLFKVKASANKPSPKKYTIPYGTRVIYMTYDILFLAFIGYYSPNDGLCVKWEIDWD
jgi:hypothetical protein